MNKLKSKVFYVIFIILSLFGFSILLIYNYQDYKESYNTVKNQLRSSNRLFFPKPTDNKNMPYRFMDSNLYTIVVNDNEIENIISHTTEGTVSDEIYKEANKIINSYNDYYIGNLYFSKYSYSVERNRIILSDNSTINTKLQNNLKITLVIIILIELVSYFISNKLSNWIIKPVEESFNKQKQFIADASHELKTPLAVIMASADTLEKDNNKKWIKNIQNESDRMNKLIKNLLDLSKVENNALFEEVNLSKLVEKSTLILESLMYEKNIKLNYNIEDNIYFECNQEEIKQLMSILLDNAIKHSINNGNIIVNLNKDKNSINLEVINKGDPIEEGEEDKIFERFYRSDKSRNRNDNRYGLGLAIAKSIVTKHNGTITAKSKDQHTTFKIVFKKK